MTEVKAVAHFPPPPPHFRVWYKGRHVHMEITTWTNTKDTDAYKYERTNNKDSQEIDKIVGRTMKTGGSRQPSDELKKTDKNRFMNKKIKLGRLTNRNGYKHYTGCHERQSNRPRNQITVTQARHIVMVLLSKKDMTILQTH